MTVFYNGVPVVGGTMTWPPSSPTRAEYLAAHEEDAS